MADINKIAEELGTLTILEAADLVKLLEEVGRFRRCSRSCRRRCRRSCRS